MSRFFSEKYKNLTPYTPGEQPQDRKYIKLNTNESPYPPAAGVLAAVSEQVDTLRLYSDPECKLLRAKLAQTYGVLPENTVVSNGSDEVLNFAFQAFADDVHPLAFADITYGFYTVFAEKNHIPYTEIPLKDDFRIDAADYKNIGKTVVIANPNAPTGLMLSLEEIEAIVQSNPNNVVIVDEAYVDFGGTSAIALTKKYDNLLVCGTFSKSRSLAGARLGFGIGNPALIQDIDTLRYSLNPYNVNSMTAAAGLAALKDDAYFRECCDRIVKTREKTARALGALGFLVIPSKTNFLFAKASWISGQALYETLRERGILVRHFQAERICDYNRITVGSEQDMQTLIQEINNIREEMQ